MGNERAQLSVVTTERDLCGIVALAEAEEHKSDDLRIIAGEVATAPCVVRHDAEDRPIDPEDFPPAA